MKLNDTRPKLTHIRSRSQRYLEIATLIILLITVLYAAIHYSALPEKVPLHFNMSGEVDGYGGKNSIWALVLLGCGLSMGLFKLNKYPHLFNYPSPITEANARKQYTWAVIMLSILNLLLALIFATLMYMVINLGLNEGHQTSQTTNYIWYFLLFSMLCLPIIWISKTASLNNTK